MGWKTPVPRNSVLSQSQEGCRLLGGLGLLKLVFFYPSGHIRKLGDIFPSPLGGSGSRGREETAHMIAEGIQLGMGLTTGRVERAALGGGHPEVG